MVLDARVFRGSEIESDHYLLICHIRKKPKWYKKEKLQHGTDYIYKISFLRDRNASWLYRRECKIL